MLFPRFLIKLSTQNNKQTQKKFSLDRLEAVLGQFWKKIVR